MRLSHGAVEAERASVGPCCAWSTPTASSSWPSTGGGRLFHYVVESVDGILTLTSTSVESWLEVRPNGVVQVVEPVDRTRELHDERNGGPSRSAAPVHSSKVAGHPLVMSFTTNDLPDEPLSIFEQIGFREGQPEGYVLVAEWPGRFRAWRL